MGSWQNNNPFPLMFEHKLAIVTGSARGMDYGPHLQW